ncbi:DUF418 domain-containing protein [Sphingomonas sp. JC676]|uniref:DUF418 domain-containing protein n=1 Tax=Sphingomonas sp. JC676 TaxID=2768065 RepID=UPI0016582914|nr:DUF418 domain-containing protein [Sphingomonas sp. JC676]MBC9032061.1 DUF418 domain-containing protein [Sphingomonas sp. JC676]
MAEPLAVSLAPVRGTARIDVLDILRGLAILGIFYINVPYMAAPVWQFSADIRSLGWSAADQNAWALINIFLAGTQRCLLELLFGAGMMVLARKAMTPDGPVAIADLYWRRNLWLLGFGLFDVFVLLWPGDILHIYALAALFLFPFRTLTPRVLLTLGLGWAVLCAIGIPEHGLRQYVDRAELVQQVDVAHAHQRAGQALTPADGKALAEWDKLVAAHKPDPELNARIAREIKAHQGGFVFYAREAWGYWAFLANEWLVWDVIEAFCTMLIGVALWKWGVIQGERSKRFYLVLMLAAYGFGVTARAIGVSETISFTLMPRTSWVTGEFARLAVGLGHLALVNWAVQTRPGNALLSVFKAPGRMAFSLYFLQQFVGKYILFAPFGFNLWGRYGWAQMAAISTMGIVLLVLFAHVWMRRFASGPFEWLWRSLAYVKWQPLLRARPSAPPLPDRFPPAPLASEAAGPAAR